MEQAGQVPTQVRARSGTPVEQITLDGVLAGEVSLDDIRIHPDTLIAQAEVATGALFDVVLANLLAPTIRELAGPLVAALAPAGRLVASGLLRDRWSEATDALAGLRVLEVDEEDDWVAVVLGR